MKIEMDGGEYEIRRDGTVMRKISTGFDFQCGPRESASVKAEAQKRPRLRPNIQTGDRHGE